MTTAVCAHSYYVDGGPYPSGRWWRGRWCRDMNYLTFRTLAVAADTTARNKLYAPIVYIRG